LLNYPSLARVLFGLLPFRGHVGLVVAEGRRDVFGLGTLEEAVEERVLFGVACFLGWVDAGAWHGVACQE